MSSLTTFLLFPRLDEGVLTDSHGRKADFKNTILILTSNIGSDILLREDSILPDGTVSDSAKEEVLARVAALYPPELVCLVSSSIPGFFRTDVDSTADQSPR